MKICFKIIGCKINHKGNFIHICSNMLSNYYPFISKDKQTFGHKPISFDRSILLKRRKLWLIFNILFPIVLPKPSKYFGKSTLAHKVIVYFLNIYTSYSYTVLIFCPIFDLGGTFTEIIIILIF